MSTCPHVTESHVFDFTAFLRDVCADMIARLPELKHIELSRVAFSFVRSRKRTTHGTQATLTPMRFEGGASSGIVDGQRFTVDPLRTVDGRDVLYLFHAYVPRFLDLSCEEKLITILHELWHISPQFNGDLRRFPGRNYVHSNSEAAYDRLMLEFAQRWRAQEPKQQLIEVLSLDSARLQERYGRVVGYRIAMPRLVPVG